MATTLGQIKNKVAAIVLDVNPEVSGELTGFVNTAQRELEDMKFCPDQKLLRDFITGINYSNSYSFDDELFLGLRVTPFRIYHEDGSLSGSKTTILLTELSGDQVSPKELADIGTPIYWSMSGYTFNTYPRADTNGELTPLFTGSYYIRVPYWSRLGDMVNDSETNWFTDNATNFLIWRAAEQGLEFNRDPMATRYAQKAMMEKRRLRKVEMRKAFNTSKVTIVPTESSRLGSR